MTSIKTYCRLIQSEAKGAGAPSKFSTSENQLCNAQDNSAYLLSKIYGVNVKQNEVFADVSIDLIRYFLSGYNTCLLLFGEARNRLSQNILPYLVQQIFNELGKQNKLKETRRTSISASRGSKKGVKKDDITMKTYSIQNEEVLSDLQTPKSSSSSFRTGENIELVEDDIDGFVVKNSHSIYFNVNTISDINHVLTDSLKNNLNEQSRTASVVEFCLEKVVAGLDIPITCWFRVIYISASYVEDYSFLGSLFQNVLSSYGNKTPSEQTELQSSSSLLQNLLDSGIGGNCVTKALFTLDGFITTINTKFLDTAVTLKKIFNHPVENTPHMKGLLRQYRRRLKSSQRLLIEERNINKAYVDELKNRISVLNEDNVTLKEENLNLENFIKELKNNIDTQAMVLRTQSQNSQTDSQNGQIDSQKGFSEVEKLQMSRDVIEMRLLANKVQQQAEKQIFEMKSKLLVEQEKVSKYERNLAFERKTHSDTKEKLARVKSNHDELLEEYINLKSNYNSMSTDYQQQGHLNEELNITISKLSDLKDQIVVEKKDAQYKLIKDYTEQLLKLKDNLANSNHVATDFNVDFTPKNVSTEQHSEDEIKELEEKHNNEMQEFEKIMFSLKRDVNDKEEVISSYKTKFARITSRMLMIKEEKESDQTRYSDLELRLFELSKDYKQRLEQYIVDISDYLSSTSTEKNRDACSSSSTEKNRDIYFDNISKMMDDMKVTYANDMNDERKCYQQLKHSTEMILNKHEKLLIAYRLMYQKSNQNYNEEDFVTYDILLPPDDQLQAISIKERNELKTKLYISEEKIKDLEDKIEHFKSIIKRLELNEGNHEPVKGNSWNTVRRKVKDYASSVQHNLEKEKAELLTRCHLAEQQLESYREIMSDNKIKYEMELNQMRHALESYTLKSKPNLINRPLAIESDRNGFFPPIHQHQNYKPYDLG